MKDLFYAVVYVLLFYFLVIVSFILGLSVFVEASGILFCLLLTLVVSVVILTLYKLNKKYLVYSLAKVSMKKRWLWIAVLLSPFIVAIILAIIQYKILVILIYTSPLFITNIVFIRMNYKKVKALQNH
ncbi:hypothetical protein HMPREF9714_00839 [Myroides odoratimimus CCUG 12901]|uniref:Uncharacterized protein n=2 Tax=Myroides odoratimimus TaxID=76832 RepID=A0A0U3G8A7_9FLAO|nr:hypothetical protein [Myroides odoratimimus]AJA69089.1 hypothetical protein MYRA21_1953 [Myroides sp. A21]APA92377.1 hypothetical protein BK054_09150 [Myroides sp. ZB35]EHO12194.1 hypothetical protein HMPREF9712_00441 [Myroides odoratimimus CCUG 10230]EHO13282.1 hypothetical protein HMPREF9714_00839 [Myroides odoratimimus CCUG 12901]EPH11550.1 hypothetical protein HMPREF9713_02040 [Myroides odoratimimus CCUG 12700]SHL71106.1 hypothetical protein SAMN05444275_10622 [Myroides odoratimimus su